MSGPSVSEHLDAARVGFAGTTVSPAVQDRALDNLARWVTESPFAAYRPQVLAMIVKGQWSLLLDCFYQVLPFGTGGRRGTVGVGPNRFNPWTLGASVQGHVAHLRATRGEGPLSVVIAYDVRRFQDLGARLAPGVPSPVDGLTSRSFAELAAEVYAAAGILVHMPPRGTYLSTPELSFAIRELGADGGLNISASHNPPDDNGGKVYNATGGQEVPPWDEMMAQQVDAVAHIERMPLDRAMAAGLVREIGPEVHEAYIRANLACSLDPQARGAHVVFTGLHGTGRATVVETLSRAGFRVDLEPTQADCDGAFPNVPFRVPYPEVPQSMQAAAAWARNRGADIALACDPDADRLGLVVPVADGAWRFLTGNEIASLICHYVLSRGRQERPLVICTEVTTRMLRRIADLHGARIVDHLLVGFKYIADGLDSIERTGAFADLSARIEDFALGAEESHGVLVTSAVRDKDAAGGALLLAELASQQKAQGRTLVDALHDIWRECGYVRNALVSTVMRGAEGGARIRAIQQALRGDPPRRIAGREVVAFHDRQDPSGPFGPIRSETDRMSRDVLVWEMEGGARLVLRPSGTEPKNKVYAEVAGTPGADLQTEVPRVDRACRELADAFALHMLSLVGIRLPPWALRVSDLVAIEHKVHFADTVMPGLLERLCAGGPREEVAAWLDRAIASYGSDARGLVAGAARAYVEAFAPACGDDMVALFP